MTSIQRAKIRQVIQEQMDSLTQTIAELEPMCTPISPECALGDLARFELMHDQQAYEKMLFQSKKRYQALKHALSNIDKSDFAHCKACDEPIGFERLLLLPESRLCISCANMLNQ